MSIDDIKDIKKLQKMYKSAFKENKYLKKCCINAGTELQKYSFEWDGKEKNLVIQALYLNELFEKQKQSLNICFNIAYTIVNGMHFTTDIEGHLKLLAKEILDECKGYIDAEK